MSIIRQLSYLLIVMCVACSPKTTVDTTTPPEPPTPPTPPVERSTPCTTFNDLNTSERDQAETAYVLYKDFLKAGDLAQAHRQWKRAYTLAPGSNGRVKYQYEDGVKIYEQLHQQTDDKALKDRYVDTIMMIYDQRVECFGGQAYIDGRKGFDYYYKYSNKVSQDQIFDLFRSAADAGGEDMDYFIVNPFTKMLHDRLIEGQIPHQEALPHAKTIIAAIEKGKTDCKGTLCDAWKTIDKYASAQLTALEGVDDFYDCDYYTDRYYTAYEADPENCEVIELAYRRMLRGKCPADDSKLMAVKASKDEKCYTPPPPPGNLRQGFDCYSSGDYRCAIEKFLAYVDSTDDSEKKAKYLLTVAKIYYGDIRDFPSSRKYAKMAAVQKPKWGDPYILIGKLYASSGPLCGPGTGWDSQVVTWPAIDMFTKAKQVDPSVASEANKWIRDYQQYMPSKGDIFQRTNLTMGGPFKVKCWINETTTVRAAP